MPTALDGPEAWGEFFGDLDTKFRKSNNVLFFYNGGIGPGVGHYYGSAINYIGVGEGFAAAGFTPAGMMAGVTYWRMHEYGFFRGGELSFASLGYVWWLGHQ